MSRLLAIIDRYKDTHGQPSDASIARAIDIKPQTLSSWRNRGIRELPDAETLRRLAGFVGVPHLTVLYAALIDTGRMDESELPGRPAVEEVGEHDRPAAM